MIRTVHRPFVAIALVLVLSVGCSGGPATSPSATATVATPTPTPSPSPEATPSQASPTETPDPTAAAVPDEWTQVHTIGDGSTRMVGGEIAWGDAGFLALARRFEAGEGGPRPVESTMWRSADGLEWSEVQYPVPAEGTYSPMALTGAADGSYVLHAVHGSTDVVESLNVSLRSTDGEMWEELETGLPDELYIQAIEEGPAGFLLVAGQGAETDPTLWLSADALTWELVHEFSQDEQFVQLHDGDGGAEGYVVMGRRIEHDSSSYERFTLASADGREWVERSAPFGPDDQEFVWEVAVSSRGGDWLATLGQRDETTSLWSSANGLEWAQAGTLDARNATGVSAGLMEEVGDEIILAPGASMAYDGTPGAWSSTDGTTWSPIDLSADAWVGELAIGDGVVAMTGTVAGPAEGFTSTGLIWIRASD